MKANAPEKIYLHPDLDSIFGMTERSCESEIEYTRTDTFIEKACEYMRNHIDQQLTIYHEQTWKKRDEFIEHFRKYMEN